MIKIAFDVSPIEDTSVVTHRVRGTGFYTKNLKDSLLKYYPQNSYVFFSKQKPLSQKVEIIHYPYFEPFFLSIPIIKRAKIVITVHDLTPLVFPKNFPIGIKGMIKWNMQKLLLQTADAIITDSLSSKEDIKKHTHVPFEKINVIYLASGENFKKLENSESMINVKKKHDLPDKFALYVGDVTWNKNLPRLIMAIKKIKIPLVMVGKALISENFDKNNPWNQDLLAVQKLIENDRNIERLGFVSNTDLVFLYNLASVFVMPSLYEGFGLPLLEAMQCGCPVVTSQEGSIPEVVGESAHFVDAYNVDSIAKGIKLVFSNQKIQKDLSQKGLLQAKKFNWKKTASQTLDVYRSVF